jgi:hypothetical protein
LQVQKAVAASAGAGGEDVVRSVLVGFWLFVAACLLLLFLFYGGQLNSYLGS